MSHSNSYNLQDTQSPQRSLQSNPIELHSDNGSDDLHPALNCMVSCWRVCSWLVSIILYILEILVLVWVAYTYGKCDLYLLFGLTLAYLPLPTVVLATVSLVWYYNLDRFNRRRREQEPQNMDSSIDESKKKLTVGAITLHVFLLGMVYRYGQLIYLTILGKKTSLPFLRRDTALLRFLHSTIISAPQLVIQLYAIQLALDQTTPLSSDPGPLNPPILASVGLCILSLLYAVLSFTTNDRLSGKDRRVILPAHIIQSLWYLCVMASRVIALAVFAYSYGYWVYVLVGGHWILMFLFLVIQRTTFCADIELQPTDDGNSPQRTFKRRWSLEIPFYFVAATVYIFTFFNMKHGRTWYLLTPFHLLMFAENVAMGVLFYLSNPSLMYAKVALTVVAGLYPVGMFFMVIYYCLCHPSRTEDWYWAGIPRRISCSTLCCFCCSSDKRGGGGEALNGFQNRTSVSISGPTLVSHNGFLPDNMIPVGVPRSPLPEGISEAVDAGPTHVRNAMPGVGPDRIAARLTQRQEPRNQISSLAIVSPDSTNENVQDMDPRSLTTPTESNPVFSDVPSQFLASELDTDVDSNVIRAENVDTVIDTPLAGFTPEPFDMSAVHMLQRNGRMKSVESQRADTNDTGIDVESDVLLTPGTTSVNRQEDLGQHHFLDIPAKRRNYMSERSKLEQHYFPEEQRRQQTRDSGSVTPTLPTPNWSVSPASNSPHSGRVTWGNHTSDSSPEHQRRNITPGTISSQSQQSPDRSRKGNNALRSPKGARAFAINAQGTDHHMNQQHQTTEGQSGYPQSGHEKKQIAPRSPKGARRLMISTQQSTTSTASAPVHSHNHHYPQHHHQQRQISERQIAYYPPSPHRSPTRQPRGAQGYPSSSPERTLGNNNSTRSGVGMPQHMVPQYGPTTANSQGYPAHRSPARLPRSVSGYQHQNSEGSVHMRSHEATGINRESHWDSWTAQNTHINAAQAAATSHLRVEGGATGGGAGGRGGMLHKEMSPSSKSDNVVDVERNRSFNVPRRAQNVNPYYSPYTPKRPSADSAPQSSNYPPLRRTPGGSTSSQPRQINYQQQYPRYSGEYNPRFSVEVENRLHVHAPGQGRISESYPSPGVARNSAPMIQMPPLYPRTPQGAAARAPRMARSPDKRLKSMSPQRSILSYGSGAGGGGGGGWEGGARGGAMGSRPNSLHSNSSAFTPHQRHLLPAARHSDGASAVMWGNVQWGGRRSPRLNTPVLHVPRSSTHESAV